MGHDERVAALTRKIHDRPREAGLYVLRAEAYRRLGRYERALRDLATADRLDPSLAQIPCERALVRSDRGVVVDTDIRAFERDAERCLSVYPARTDIFVARASYYAASGQLDLAVADWRAAWELRPAPDLAVGYALALERFGSTALAMQVLRDAAQRLDGATSIHRLGVELALRQGRPVDANAHAEALVAAAPGVADFHLLRARALLAAGEPTHARVAVSTASRIVEARAGRRSALHLAARVRVRFAAADDAAAQEAAALLRTIAGSEDARLLGDLTALAPLRALESASLDPLERSPVPPHLGRRAEENTPMP
jgi:tetratricopeptide (TPR) repeat protein